MKTLAAFNALNSIGTLLFGLPIFLLNGAIEADTESGWQERLFLDLTIANALVTPLVMGGLAYLYFVWKGHPWARILRSELCAKDELRGQQQAIAVKNELGENTRRWTI